MPGTEQWAEKPGRARHTGERAERENLVLQNSSTLAWTHKDFEGTLCPRNVAIRAGEVNLLSGHNGQPSDP